MIKASKRGTIPYVDPQLGPLQDNGGPTGTHAPAASSPAIDAGCNAACPAFDQRGAARPADGNGIGGATCDIGAYEYAAVPIVTGLSPASAVRLGPGFALKISGTNFISGSAALWNGWPRPTLFVSSTRLTAAIPAGDLTAGGPVTVTVRNPGPGDGVAGSALNFDVESRVYLPWLTR